MKKDFIFLSTAFYFVFITFSVFSAVAQERKKVEYDCYVNYEEKLLEKLKESGAISNFTGVTQLKNQTEGLKENTKITINTPAIGKEALNPEVLVEKRKKGVLSFCKYSRAMLRPERVEVGATAMILSDDGICATNYHVLIDMIDNEKSPGAIDSILFVATSNGDIYPIKEILSFNKSADLAFFRIDPGNDKLHPIPLGDDLPAGATVHTLTNPVGHLFYYSSGVVARNIATDPDDLFSNRMEITADYAKGSSGGPIMDNCGNLVAMVSTTRSIYYVDNPQSSLQMVVKNTIPVSSFRQLIAN